MYISSNREQTTYIENNIPKATSCGATLFASVILTSKLSFYIHIFWDKTFAEKFKIQILKKIAIGFPDLRLFAVLYAYKMNNFKNL